MSENELAEFMKVTFLCLAEIQSLTSDEYEFGKKKFTSTEKETFELATTLQNVDYKLIFFKRKKDTLEYSSKTLNIKFTEKCFGNIMADGVCEKINSSCQFI